MLSARPLRIALADDSRAVRGHIRELISRHEGLQVVAEAGSVADVKAILQHDDPDGIILDIAMPGNGIQALRYIKAHRPGTWVIMLTNHADAYYREVCLRAGADAFLDKSLEYDRLVAELRRLAAGDQVSASPATAHA